MPRVGVVGLGAIGALHASIVNAIPGSHLASASDSDPRLVKIFKKVAPRIKLYTHTRDMLSGEELDALFICTPIGSHRDVVLDALDAGNLRGLFLEKPLAVDLSEGLEMVQAANRAGTDTMVGFQKRHISSFRLVKELLDSRVLGRTTKFSAHHFTAGVLRRESGWRFEPHAGGVILDWGAHLVDLLTWFFGEPKQIEGERRRVHSAEVEDYVRSHWAFASGMEGVIEISWSNGSYRNAELALDIECEKGRIQATESSLEVTSESLGKEELDQIKAGSRPAPGSVPFLLGQPENTLQDQFFLEAIELHKRTVPSMLDSLKCQAVLDRLRGFPLQ